MNKTKLDTLYEVSHPPNVQYTYSIIRETGSKFVSSFVPADFEYSTRTFVLLYKRPIL